MEIKTLDIFCEIIDNYGDIGVVYRLAKDLHSAFDKKVKIRVFLNRLDEFLAINKSAKNTSFQYINGIEYISYDYLTTNINEFSSSDVIIESFGCNIPQEYLDIAYDNSSLLINLEYLSGEDWIEDFHLQSSHIGAKKLKKFFFMPGFTEKTGGVIIDSSYVNTLKKVRENKDFYKTKFLGKVEENTLIGTIFSYEKNFQPLMRDLKKLDKKILLLLMGEKTQLSFKKFLSENNIEIFENIAKYDKIEMRFMNFFSQEEYEEIINICDFNFYRGEDSFIRGVLNGIPFIWHIYCQENYVHLKKLESFFEKYGKIVDDDIFTQNMYQLFKDYNFRTENNFDLGNEDYSYFFNNLDKISKNNNIFKDFLFDKCNLIDKLKTFILKYQEV